VSASIYSHLRNCQAPPATARRMKFWEAVQEVVRHWRSRRQERRMFASLDGRDLHDLGLSQWDVEREIARPFWRD
jgi:uncharacterized protein YjiS (DUF1127 family)